MIWRQWVDGNGFTQARSLEMEATLIGGMDTNQAIWIGDVFTTMVSMSGITSIVIQMIGSAAIHIMPSVKLPSLDQLDQLHQLHPPL